VRELFITAEGATTPETLRHPKHKKLIIWRAMIFSSTEGVSQDLVNLSGSVTDGVNCILQ